MAQLRKDLAREAATAAVPRWVYVFDRDEWWDAAEQPPPDKLDDWRRNGPHNADWSLDQSVGHWRWCQAHRRWRRASEAWCAERGYSFCRTVLGWRRPSPSEIATDQTGSPWGDAGRPEPPPRVVVDRGTDL